MMSFITQHGAEVLVEEPVFNTQLLQVGTPIVVKTLDWDHDFNKEQQMVEVNCLVTSCTKTKLYVVYVEGENNYSSVNIDIDDIDRIYEITRVYE